MEAEPAGSISIRTQTVTKQNVLANVIDDAVGLWLERPARSPSMSVMRTGIY